MLICPNIITEKRMKKTAAWVQVSELDVYLRKKSKEKLPFAYISEQKQKLQI